MLSSCTWGWAVSTVRQFLLLLFSRIWSPLSLRLRSALQLAVRAGMRNLPVLHGLTEGGIRYFERRGSKQKVVQL